MNPWIAGIGTAVPPHRISSTDAAQIAQRFACETAAQERLFATLYRRAGVETRHSVVLEASEGDLDRRQSFYGPAHPTTRDRLLKYESEAGALAVAAGRAALEDAAIAPRRVTHVVSVSCSGFYAPGFDVALMKQLPLDPDVARTHVGFMGCHGALNGLRVARGFVQADPGACVLLCSVELCSLHHQYGWDAEKIVANALFADGAAAAVILPGEGATKHERMQKTTISAPCELVASGSTLIEDSEDAMTWRIGDHGFEMTLSPRVPELIGRHLRPWLEGWLARHGLSMETVGSWAVHPGGPRILSAFGEATALDRSVLEASYELLASHGNMSSATILFLLDRLRRRGAGRPWVALAFGPGLAVEAAILE
jgi:predicted naringenin-chalcone synthase